jgi:N-acetylneuraminate lyase
VGSNCLEDARVLARHAQDQGAVGISAVAPAYFKPRTMALQLDCCAEIASAAPELTFFHYDIPGMTGFSLPMGELMEKARERIPTFGGLKFSNMDLMMLQQCLNVAKGELSVAFGCDESLLAAVALGCTSAVGSTYNFVAPAAQRAWRAFEKGDLATARAEQFKVVRLVEVLNRRGYLGSAKVLMKFLGVDMGPMRLPNPSLDAQQELALRADLQSIGFFGWETV